MIISSWTTLQAARPASTPTGPILPTPCTPSSLRATACAASWASAASVSGPVRSVSTVSARSPGSSATPLLSSPSSPSWRLVVSCLWNQKLTSYSRELTSAAPPEMKPPAERYDHIIEPSVYKKICAKIICIFQFIDATIPAAMPTLAGAFVDTAEEICQGINNVCWNVSISCE